MKSLNKLLVVSVALLGLGLTAVSIDAQACACGKRYVVRHHHHVYRNYGWRYYNTNAGILTQAYCCKPTCCRRACCGGPILENLF